MRSFLKVLKWLGGTVGAVLALIVLSGLVFRLFSPQPAPPGRLVDIGDFKLHINTSGEKGNGPTVVIEGGGGMATEYFHWLSEALKDSMRVVRYDRAGIGYSDPSNTPRDPETIARELHTLLDKAGEAPPYILVGHSLGGPYIRVFTELYPDEVEGMFLLDSTHPDRVKRIKTIPSQSSTKFNLLLWTYKLQGFLCDLGVMMLYDKLTGPVSHREMEGLPDEVNQRTFQFLNGGKYARTMGKEMEEYHATLERAGEVRTFGTLPVRIFSDELKEIPDEVYKKYLARGRDLRDSGRKSMEMQKELVNLSTNSKITFLEGDHTSIFTKKENADAICKEVLQVARELGR